MTAHPPSIARKIALAAVAGATVTCALPAAAQYQRPVLPQNNPAIEPIDRTGEDQPGVMTRPYPEFDPPGIAVGSFTLSPRLVTDLGYSDNI